MKELMQPEKRQKSKNFAIGRTPSNFTYEASEDLVKIFLRNFDKNKILK